MTARRPVLIANCSGFYGDRIEAAREMVEGGPIDVLTGDYLAELTMLILWKARQKDPDAGYAKTFLTQLEQVLGTCLDRGIRIVTNAGGLNPAGLARAVADLGQRLGLAPRVAYIEGDDLTGRIDELIAAGHSLAHLDTGQPLAEAGIKPVTANAYLGGWGIAEALGAGADVVVCPRVTDASLVVGPAAWWHGWRPDDHDALAGAVAAGHVIECGPQATGGNYSWLHEITDRRYPGFPIAEVAADGSSVITKHPDTGGLVSPGTVTAQLLYEIAEPAYLNPDVVAHFDTLELAQDGPDRVRISGTRGSPPPGELKVAINYIGGYRNTMTLVLTGLDIEEKAAWAEQELFGILGGRDSFAEVDVRLLRFDREDAPDQRAGHRAPADHGQGPGPAQGGPRVLQRDHGTGARRVRRIPHHDPADPGERLRRVLAGARPGQRGGAHRGAARWLPADGAGSGSGLRSQLRSEYGSRTKAMGGPSAARYGVAGAIGARVCRAVRGQGGQRQRRRVDPRRAGVPLAAGLPHGRAAGRAHPGGRRPADPALRAAQPARAQLRDHRTARPGGRVVGPARPAGQGAGGVPAQPASSTFRPNC